MRISQKKPADTPSENPLLANSLSLEHNGLGSSLTESMSKLDLHTLAPKLVLKDGDFIAAKKKLFLSEDDKKIFIATLHADVEVGVFVLSSFLVLFLEFSPNPNPNPTSSSKTST
jgi:hypothetical protein